MTITLTDALRAALAEHPEVGCETAPTVICAECGHAITRVDGTWQHYHPGHDDHVIEPDPITNILWIGDARDPEYERAVRIIG